MESENKIFTEFGVHYTRDIKAGKELGYTLFRYTALYGDSKFERLVYCENTGDFNKLLAGWNRVDARWKFFV